MAEAETVRPANHLNEGGRCTWSFQVRHYELNPAGVARPEVYLNWLQEAGLVASAHAGYPIERYEAMGRFWWVRRLRVEWYGSALYREPLEATTWISDFRRVQCHREYQIRRGEDGELICSAQGNWAFVDIEAGQPVRIPDELIQAFSPDGVYAIASRPWPWDAGVQGGREFTTRRKVQYHELDTMGHVNHAFYLVWLLESVHDCLDAGRLLGGGLTVVPQRFDIEYLHAAGEGDRLLVSSRPTKLVGGQGMWTHRVVLDAPEQTLVARAHSVCAFSGAEGPVWLQELSEPGRSTSGSGAARFDGKSAG